MNAQVTTATRPGHVGITFVTLTVNCRAFSCEGRRPNRIRVSSTGEVRVWDSIAGFFTLVHSLTPRQEARIRVLARKVLADR